MLGYTQPPGQTSPWSDTPQADTHLVRHPPWADTPWADTPRGRHPRGRHLPGQTPTWADTPLADTPWVDTAPVRHTATPIHPIDKNIDKSFFEVHKNGNIGSKGSHAHRYKKTLDVSENTQRIESSIFVLLKFNNRFLKQTLQNPNSVIFRQIFA